VKWHVLLDTGDRMRFPGFRPSPILREVTVEAETEEEAREIAPTIATPNFPTDGKDKVVSVQRVRRWEVTFRSRRDRRRRHTFTVDAVDEAHAVRFARYGPGGRSAYYPLEREPVKVVAIT
jgi:hypothetical protein